MKPINIVFTTDRRYLKPMAAAMASVIAHTPNTKLDIYILHNSIETKQQQQFCNYFNTELVSINFKQVQPKQLKNLILPSSNYESFDYFSQAIYFRLLIPYLLPNTIEKAIYLDADTISCHSIKSLWDINLGTHPLGAVVEPCSPEDPPGFRYNHENDLNLSGYYFNSGVLLLDLEKLRKVDLLEKSKQIIKKNNLIFPDQDIFNVIFNNNFLLLPPKYNSLCFSGSPAILNLLKYFLLSGKKNPYPDNLVLEAGNQPHILHFFGKYKPWHFPGLYFAHKELFWHFYNRTFYKTDESLLIEELLKKIRDNNLADIAAKNNS
jgi:lipopolysaccharide biosynthesis glycosyltransferase